MLTLRAMILTTLLLLAAATAADAVYMIGKARVAQWLIQQSWNSNEIGAKPWPWADTFPVAKIQVPQIDLQAWVLNGASGHALSFGPGLADGSVAPGQPGVVMIAGHRDTDFRPLQKIAPGDDIYLEDQARNQFVYRVQDIAIADARYASIMSQSTNAQLILVTCYPFDALTAGGHLRYVVQAQRIDPNAATVSTELNAPGNFAQSASLYVDPRLKESVTEI